MEKNPHFHFFHEVMKSGAKNPLFTRSYESVKAKQEPKCVSSESTFGSCFALTLSTIAMKGGTKMRSE